MFDWAAIPIHGTGKSPALQHPCPRQPNRGAWEGLTPGTQPNGKWMESVSMTAAGSGAGFLRHPRKRFFGTDQMGGGEI